MSYDRLNLQSGILLKAEHIKHLEDGIAQNDENIAKLKTNSIVLAEDSTVNEIADAINAYVNSSANVYWSTDGVNYASCIAATNGSERKLYFVSCKNGIYRFIALSAKSDNTIEWEIQGIGGDGVGIKSIEKTATNGLVDTYTITLTDGSTKTFTVTNGKDGKTPYIQDGYWYIDGVNTNVKAVGTDGKDGTDGTNGKDGEDGVSIVGNHIVKQYPVNGIFSLEAWKRYKIKKTSKYATEWGFTVDVKYKNTIDLKEGTYTIQFPACTRYDDYLNFRFLEVVGETLGEPAINANNTYEVFVIAEVNGEVKRYSAGTVTKFGIVTFTATSVTLNGASECYLINEDAYIDLGEDGKVSSDISLGLHTDGLLYVFVDGKPVGNGIALPSGGASGDVVGNIDSGNNIILSGDLADGTYTIKYEMADGSTVNIGNLVLDTRVRYTVTTNLTNCTINNSAKVAIAGESYVATVTAADGYELKTLTVTMGGNNVIVSGGTIRIEKVTGDIVISAVAEEKAKEPTNFAVYDATNTSDWNKWINNARAGSDGTYRSDTVSADYGTPAVSNYIAVQNGDVVEITGMYTANKSTVVYNSSKTVLSVGSPSANSSIVNYTNVASDYTAQFTINNTSAAFLRVGGYTSIDKVGVPVIRIKRNGEYL